MITGTIAWFEPSKGYGFIERDDGKPDVFVHVSVALKCGVGEPLEGDRYAFNVVEHNGRPQAKDLRRIENVAPPSGPVRYHGEQ